MQRASRVLVLGVAGVVVAQWLAGCPAYGGTCGSGPSPRTLLGPQLGLLMIGNARGVFVAQVNTVFLNVGPLGFPPPRGEAGTFANVTIREVLHQVPPGPEQDVPLQAGGNTLDVMVSSGDFRCPASNRRLQPGDRIIMFLWRANVASHPNGTKVPWAWLRYSVLCMDGDTIHVADTRPVAEDDGIQERGNVSLAQFREALAMPWDQGGAALQEGASDAGMDFIAQRCAGVSCTGDSRCFFGAGCWSFSRQGPEGCLDGEFFSDGTRCMSGVHPAFCD